MWGHSVSTFRSCSSTLRAAPLSLVQKSSRTAMASQRLHDFLMKLPIDQYLTTVALGQLKGAHGADDGFHWDPTEGDSEISISKYAGST